MINYEEEDDRINDNIINSKIKIIDFGSAIYLQKGKLATFIIGPPLYMDPIILFKLNMVPDYEDVGYDQKADILEFRNDFVSIISRDKLF